MRRVIEDFGVCVLEKDSEGNLICECGSKDFNIIRDNEDDEPLAAWCVKCGKNVKFEYDEDDEE